ncbi:MAG: CAP domain-containing protein [Desulfobacterales bacterium]|nr:CAP domain-containing protein [Desulfobacterales bacterium]
MKTIPFFVLFICLVCIFPSLSTAGDSDFFVDATDSIPYAWETVNPEIVLRQRPVFIQFEMLSPDHCKELHLNFFEDVHMTFVLDQLKTISSEESVWIGTVLSGGMRGTATFVFKLKQLTGTVRLDSLAYQVRHIGGDLHLVREIRAPQAGVAAMALPSKSTSVETEVFALVNLERQIQNLHPLQMDSRLYAAAMGHSQDMAEQNYFDHTSLDLRTPGTRISQAGYSWSTYGENIAAGYPTSTAVVEGWMNSSGHRANILSSAFCDIGVGYAYSAESNYGAYWTQDFGRQQGVSACSSIQEYTISVSEGLHGNISPSGIVTVAPGGSAIFNITADPGYQVSDVVVDGQSQGIRGTYSFVDVWEDHTIQAFFEKTSNDRRTFPWIPLLLPAE